VLVTAPGGAQVRGKVRTVAPTVDAATRNGLVYVDLPQRTVASVGVNFKPGMYARGEFELGRSAALTVPQSAVVVRDGFSYVVRVAPDNRVAQVKVQTGRVMGDQTEILSGIKPEDKLVASGGGFLSDGDLVKVVDAKLVASESNAAVATANTASAAIK
jgi:multidrug efflux pump subunit AcrA (membrane-fusion protein)